MYFIMHLDFLKMFRQIFALIIIFVNCQIFVRVESNTFKKRSPEFLHITSTDLFYQFTVSSFIRTAFKIFIIL